MDIISAFALPSNLNLLYGQTLIYAFQTFANSGKLLFSSSKNLSTVFIDDIPLNFHNITSVIIMPRRLKMANLTVFSMIFWRPGLVKTGESPFIMIHQLDSSPALQAKTSHRLSSPSNTPSQLRNTL